MGEQEPRATATPRPPWYAPEWRASADRWIRDRVAEDGRTMAGTIAQDRAWALSCVLRAPTDRGTVYFKATADLPLFVNEARLTRCLGDILPGATPAVIASDDARGWMLTADFGQALGGDAPPEEMVAALGAWARAQRTTSTQTHALLAAGCYDRRLDGLAQRIDDLARDPATLEHLPSGASDSLLRATTQVASVCARLAEIGIPDCLVHGDLHMGNIAGGEGRYVFFDWTDACVSHPFMDGLLPYRLGDATVKGRARDAILDAWADFAPESRLREAWDLGRLACLAHHVVSYGSLAVTVPPDILEDLGEFFGTMVAELLDAVDDAP